MNEQILNLAEQANLYVNLNGKLWPRNMSAEESEDAYKKFAELIIGECSYVCESMQLLGPYKDVQDATLKDASMQIKQHFGVE